MAIIKMFPEDFSVSSFTINRFEFKKSEIVHVPGRSFHGLTFRISGRITVLSEGARRLVSDKSCVTYIPKGCAYSSEILEDGEMYVIHFETESEHTGLTPFVYKPTYPIVFENLFRSLHEIYRGTGKQDYSSLSVLYAIFSELINELTSKKERPIPRRMRLVKEYIDESYGLHGITVEKLSEMAGVSQVYFRREFRGCFGVSPVEYIKKVRIENAKSLLSTALYPVSEVATRCGFDSISYFSREFARITGETPSKYARRFEESG